MNSRVKGTARLAAAGAIVILAAGLAACSGSGGGKSGPALQAQTPQQAIELAASTSRDVNSFVATVSLKLGPADAAISLNGTVAEQLHPSLLAQENFPSIETSGQSIPGGMSAILTPDSVYIKLAELSTALHMTKPWIAIPFSALAKATGVNLGSLFSQLQTSSPLSQSQLFAGATNVRKVGTGVIAGVPVTEYAGTVSMTQAIAKLPADLRGSLGSAIKKAGILSASFTEWVDAQHDVRKVAVTESGDGFSEAITTTVLSVNQPVNIHLPSASQTATIPAGLLNNASGA